MTEFRDSVLDYAERQTAFVRDVAERIEQRRAEAKRAGEQFTALTPEQLQLKLKSANSPMIVYQSWSGSAAPGGTLTYRVGISNPDPVDQIWMFVHVFVGPANIVPQAGEATTAVDTRFPRLTEPAFDGLVVKAGTTEELKLELPVPSVEPSNYLGNTFLFRSTWHDPAIYFDRSLFVFRVA